MKVVFRYGRPFIRSEEAHLNIGFSCIAYLNTSFRLLPQHSNDEEKILWVAQGLHGLQRYANQYWYKHTLAYMDLVVAQKLEVVPECLVRQLDEILKYSKANPVTLEPASVDASRGMELPDQIYPSLSRFPGLSSLVSRLEDFRTSLKNQDWTQKSIAGQCSP
jgi:hypothetical protein